MDNSFSGSPFAGEESFIVKNVPRITAIQDQRTAVNVPTPAITFVVSDVETPDINLALTASSANPDLVPNQNILLEAVGSNRTTTIVPSTNQSGTTPITVTVSLSDNA